MVKINNEVSGILVKIRPTQKILEIMYPLTVYYVAVLMAMVILRIFFGIGEDSYMIRQLLTSLVVIPVIWFSFYRKDRQRFAVPVFWEHMKETKGMAGILGLIVLASAVLGTGLNNVIAMSPLPDWSEGYQEASANFYGSTLGWELISSGIVTPVLEELLFRGVIYGRLRQMIPRGQNKLVVIFLNAFIFAIMHFNMVQFVYALFLGVVLTLFMEWTKHVWGAIAGHMAANLFAVLRTEKKFLEFSIDKSAGAWIFSLLMIAAALGLIVLLYQKTGQKKSGRRDSK